MSCFKTCRSSRLSIGLCIMVGLLSVVSAKGQAPEEPQRVDFCQVVAAPADYNKKVLSVEVILWPSEHSLSLYGAACVPREDYNVTTQAVLPTAWETLPNGKKLRAILKHQRPAKVQLVGTFESDGEPYGPDVARFRFSISQIISVSKDAISKPLADRSIRMSGHAQRPGISIRFAPVHV